MYDDDFVVSNIEIINLDEPEFVYDLEVEEYHNFALECGIFVHNSNKAALAQEDLRFAGAIRQYQSHYIEGLLHMAVVHLHMNGFSTEDLSNFEIQMNINSTLAEKTRNELLEQRFTLAKEAWDPTNPGLNIMSYTQVLKEILHFTDDEVDKTIKDQMIEKKLNWRLTQLNEQGFYDEPASEAKKAALLGLSGDNDVFSSLTFENATHTPSIRKIISEKIDEEIKALLRTPKESPSAKLIETVINEDFKYESKIRRNINRVKKDLGIVK